MSHKPFVSVIVTTRNSATTLSDCLQSIKQQTYQFIETIVVDRDSTDDTKSIAKSFTTHVFNHGPERSAQRNFGVRQASGDWVLMIDSDMQLEPNVVADCVSVTSAQHRAVIIPEQSFGVGFWARCKQLERSFYHGVDWIEAARFFDRRLYLQLGGYDETMVSGEDWNLSSRAAQQTTIVRTASFIHHNEGHLQLLSTLKKKFYYAGQFKHYTAGVRRKTQAAAHGSQPTAIVLRRFGLFFADPGKLLQRPHVGIGMLFMKICEFGCGAIGYVYAKNQKGESE